MGKNRFKLSERIPNAWFHKLKDMVRGGRSGNHPIPATGNTIDSGRQRQAHVSSSTTAPTSKPRPHPPGASSPRKSYYFSRDGSQSMEFSDCHGAYETSRKWRRRSTGRTSVRSSSPRLVSSYGSSGCSCKEKVESVWTQSDSPSENSSSMDTSPDPEIRTDRLLPTESFDELRSSSSSGGFKLTSSADKNSRPHPDELPELQVELPPIITKPAGAKFSDMVDEFKKKETRARKTNRSSSLQNPPKVKIVREDATSERAGPVRRFPVSSPRLRIRLHSPKLPSRKTPSQGRTSGGSSTGGSRSDSRRNRSLSESFAVVKSSFDPQRDFRDSMVEMIVENNIRTSKDLEDLLACYLSLNLDEYHDLIIEVFKQLWFDLIDTR